MSLDFLSGKLRVVWREQTSMSSFASALAAGAFAVLSCSLARAQSAGDMLQACEALEKGMKVSHGNIFIPNGPDVNQCWGFMEAVQQYATLADQDGKTLLDSCPSPDATMTKIIRVFVNYGRAHPEKRDLKAAAVAYNAMANAFPAGEFCSCNLQRGTTGGNVDEPTDDEVLTQRRKDINNLLDAIAHEKGLRERAVIDRYYEEQGQKVLSNLLRDVASLPEELVAFCQKLLSPKPPDD